MNYYEILKVSKTASQQEIRDSYKKLIKKYHPDIYKGSKTYAEKITKELNDAYSILSNETTKKEYDALINPQIDTTYKPNSYKPDYKNMEYEEPIKPSIEDMIKKKVHKVVDDKTEKMSPKAKTCFVILVILFALLITALAIHDYINIVEITKHIDEITSNTVVTNN